MTDWESLYFESNKRIVALTEALGIERERHEATNADLKRAERDAQRSEQRFGGMAGEREAMKEQWLEMRRERDALAHVIEQARRTSSPDVQSSWRDRAAEVDAILYASTAESDLKSHDDELKAQALEEAADVIDDRNDEGVWAKRWLIGRAYAIREQSK